MNIFTKIARIGLVAFVVPFAACAQQGTKLVQQNIPPTQTPTPKICLAEGGWERQFTAIDIQSATMQVYFVHFASIGKHIDQLDGGEIARLNLLEMAKSGKAIKLGEPIAYVPPGQPFKIQGLRIPYVFDADTPGFYHVRMGTWQATFEKCAEVAPTTSSGNPGRGRL